MSRVRILARVAVTAVFSACSAGGAIAGLPTEASSLCDKLGAHEAVFVGTTRAPVERRVLAAPDLKPEVMSLQPVTVDRAYRGAKSPVMYLHRVAPPLPAGVRYLIYADRFGAPADIVTPTMIEREEDAAADLEFLESLVLTPSTGTIHGVVTGGDVYNERRPRSPLANVPIRFSTDAYTTEVVTAEDGSFVASGFPDGFVQVEPLLPDHLMAPPRAVRVRAAGCVPHHITVAMNGRVRGRVLRHDGTPYNWFVDLIPIDGARESRQIRVRANEAGEFEFSGQPPGEYFVGVNLANRQYERDVRTYYPGTTNREEALRIVVSEGTVRDGLEFRLLPEVAGGEVVVRVDTRGAAEDVGVCVAGTSSGCCGVYRQSAPGGPIVVHVLEGREYRVLAHVERGTGHSQSREIVVTGTAGRQELTLVADQPASRHYANDLCGDFWQVPAPPTSPTHPDHRER